MRKGIYGLVIENRNILVVEKKGKYILPGGKPNSFEERDKEVLKREFREELSGTEVLVDLYYKDFEGTPPNNKKEILTKNYFCYPFGNLGEPSREISEKAWVNSFDLRKKSFSDITKKVLNSLVEDDLID